jgi:competence protein ComEA
MGADICVKENVMRKLLGMLFICMSLISVSAWAAPVNINSADAATLSSAIKGVGEKKAQAIVKYRKEHGPFRSVDELANVPGIGAKTVEKNRSNLTVGKNNNNTPSAGKTASTDAAGAAH